MTQYYFYAADLYFSNAARHAALRHRRSGMGSYFGGLGRRRPPPWRPYDHFTTLGSAR
jgi:hypothetical protein